MRNAGLLVLAMVVGCGARTDVIGPADDEGGLAEGALENQVSDSAGSGPGAGSENDFETEGRPADPPPLAGESDPTPDDPAYDSAADDGLSCGEFFECTMDGQGADAIGCALDLSGEGQQEVLDIVMCAGEGCLMTCVEAMFGDLMGGGGDFADFDPADFDPADFGGGGFGDFNLDELLGGGLSFDSLPPECLTCLVTACFPEILSCGASAFF